eukprot:scaffold54632_cov60-Phaeocystis_antarctica.AAC.2
MRVAAEGWGRRRQRRRRCRGACDDDIGHPSQCLLKRLKRVPRPLRRLAGPLSGMALAREQRPSELPEGVLPGVVELGHRHRDRVVEPVRAVPMEGVASGLIPDLLHRVHLVAR